MNLLTYLIRFLFVVSGIHGFYSFLSAEENVQCDSFVPRVYTGKILRFYM